ncbi:MAG: cation:dicarboxylase symporter family transporter [Eubacterium sp.]|nr:cation:dicarboxylase symporter family transporter [Eubacterium sp.]
MRITPEKETFTLNPAAIDEVSAKVYDFLKKLKVQNKNILETRLTIEETLLEFMDRFGEGGSFTYVQSNLLGKPYISLDVEGDPYNPLEDEGDDDFGNWTSSLLANVDYTPSYSFNRGVNTITIRFSRKQTNPIIKLFLALAIAIIVSLLRFIVAPETITFIRENVLEPLYGAFLGLMATVEMPLVFLSIGCGIIGIGDSTVFGRIGRKMVLRFVTVILFLTSISGIIFSMFFTKFSSNESEMISVKAGIDILLGLIPKNLVDPLVTGNTMQTVVMAVVISIAIVMLGDKAKAISNIVNEGNRIIVFITGLISKLLPFFIFIIIVNMIWSGDIKLFINMWKPIVVYICVLIVTFLLMLITVSSKEKVPALLLIKKMLPTFLIGVGTASSIAANGECSESLKKKMGVNKRFVDFGQPVGGVVFMPSTAMNFMVCAIYMASYYNVDVSILWFIIAIVICTFVAVATPPVPGGAIAAYTVIFSQLGIPSDAVAIVIALDILFDFIATAFDGAFLQLELIRQADENKMLNFDILRKE